MMPDDQKISQPQTCGHDEPAESTGFQAIDLDLDQDASADTPIIVGEPQPADDTAEIKSKLVHKLMGGAMSLPNYVLLARDEQPLTSLDIDNYDKHHDNMAMKASHQLAGMIDLNPTFAKWLAQAVEWERQYGDIGMFAGTLMKSVVMEMGMRKEAEKEAEKKKQGKTPEKPEEEATAPETQDTEEQPPVGGIDPEQGIIDEPEE